MIESLQTELLSTSKADILVSADYLRNGEVVVFPTDTVYGIGVNAFDANAIGKLYAAKIRPLEKGIPILISDIDVLPRVTTGDLPLAAQALIEQYWPGPLTLILHKHPALPANISPNDGIAVRIPGHDILRQLIRAAGGAIATSSANLSSEAPAQTGLEAFDKMQGRVRAVVDGGQASHGLSSTILDCRGDEVSVLRAGPISISG